MSIKIFPLFNSNRKQVATALDFGIKYKDDTMMCLWLSLCGPLNDLRNDVTPAYLKQLGTARFPDLSQRGAPADSRAIQAIAESFNVKITVRFMRFTDDRHYQITDVFEVFGTGLNRIELGWDGGHFVLMAAGDDDVIDDMKARYQTMMQRDLSDVPHAKDSPPDLIEQFKRAQRRVNELAEMQRDAEEEVERLFNLINNNKF